VFAVDGGGAAGSAAAILFEARAYDCGPCGGTAFAGESHHHRVVAFASVDVDAITDQSERSVAFAEGVDLPETLGSGGRPFLEESLFSGNPVALRAAPLRPVYRGGGGCR